MTFRYPGNSIAFGPNRLSANELNRTNEQVQRAERERLGLKNLAAEPEYLTWWIWVKNDSGADRKRFETVSIEPPVMDLETDGSVDLILSATLSDPAKTPAILIDEIADGEVGRAVAYGCGLALVEAGSTALGYATPNTSSTLDPSGSGPLKLLAPPNASVQSLVPVLWVGGQSKRDIEYTIDSAEVAESGHYTGLMVCEVTVEVSSDSALVGQSAQVIDHSPCLANPESPEALVGRYGWATERYALSLDSGAEPGTITPLHFSMDGLCCP